MTLQPSTPRYQPHSTPRSTWPQSAAAKALLAYRATTVRSAESLAMLATDLGIDRLWPSLRNATATLESWLSDQRWPVRPLRIGIVSPGRWCEALFNQASPLPVEWYALARGSTPAAQSNATLDEQADLLPQETVPLEWLSVTHGLPRAEALRDLALDAVVESCGDGGLLIRTLEHSRLPAACADWSLERSVSFPTVFPCRLDVASLHWPEVRSDEWNLAHQLLIAAAAFSREPARVSLTDMLDGRRAITERFDDAGNSLDLEMIDAQRPWTDAALDAVAESLASLTLGQVTPVRVAAAKLVAAAASQTTWHTTDEIRLAAAKAAVQTLPGDATCLLQAAAAQIGCLHDDAGLATLRRAHEAVEALAAGTDIDNIAFLHAEANAGSQDSLTTGRLAAGMCIALSHLSPDRARFIIEDFLEELRDTGLLVGCDADLAVLRRAYATLTSNAAPAIQSHMFIVPPQEPEATKPEVSRTRRRGSRRKVA